MSKRKISIVILLLLFCGIAIAAFQSVPATFTNIEDGLIVWSTYDFTSAKSISGIQTSRYGDFNIYDYLRSETYVGLSYPYKYGAKVYYTTEKQDTGEECIVERAGGETTLILSQYGKITYKKMHDDHLYYIFENQIRKLDMSANIDTEIVNGVEPTYGFDINSIGEILYTSAFADKLMLLKPVDNTAITICDGRAAKFIDDDNIIFAESDKIYRMSLANNKTKVIKSKVNCTYILLNPAKTHIIYTCLKPTPDAPDMYAFEELYVMSIDGKNHKMVNGFRRNIPDSKTYGIGWVDM